jgi:RNA recognition motif-containing protein
MSNIKLGIVEIILNTLQSSDFNKIKQDLDKKLQNCKVLQIIIKNLKNKGQLYSIMQQSLVSHFQKFYKEKISFDLKNTDFYKQRLTCFPLLNVPYFENLIKASCQIVKICHTYLLSNSKDIIIKNHIERLFNEINIPYIYRRLDIKYIEEWLSLMIYYFEYFGQGFLCKWLHLSSQSLMRSLPQLRILIKLSLKQIDVMKLRYNYCLDKKWQKDKNDVIQKNTNSVDNRGRISNIHQGIGNNINKNISNTYNNYFINVKNEDVNPKKEKREFFSIKKSKPKKKIVDSKCIFIGNLHQLVTKNELAKIFKRYQPITSIQLKKGFAFINFYDKDMAKDALTLHNHVLYGKPIKLKFKEIIQKYGMSDLKNQRTIRVQPIVTNNDLQTLKSKFAKCGEITKIWRSIDNIVKIEFVSTKSVETSISTMHGILFNGKKLIVDIANRLTSKLFISYIPISSKKLKKKIESIYGTNSIKTIDINSRGIFVTFENILNVAKIIKTLDCMEFMGHTLDMYPFLPLEESMLYGVTITGFPPYLKKIDIKKDFKHIGHILRLNYRRGKECYISFHSKDAMNKMLKYNGSMYRSRKIFVSQVTK